ncbi:E3 ubiquitin-protein ligase RING1-like [Chenopodium quinoa]|uniref:E3 ubiquitin-protein ligase RING1-like n=1 Tax=Chenopodium quinoa TaxID=63459 RepID=UPI000B787877|nr:E3 ubiquitin-protein ligase RING1-like [Chenopodium quinoa]
MSSAGVAVAPPQSYFCYQCNRTVTLTPTPNSDLSCPNCSGGFLEEYDSIPQNPNPNRLFGSSAAAVYPDPFSLFADPLFTTAVSRGPGGLGGPAVFSSTTIDLQNPRNFSPFMSPSSGSPAFNPFDFLQNYLQQSGANVQFVVENDQGDPNFRLPTNFGDYFLGPGLEQLIQQLAENDPNRYGTPPASKRAIDGLPNVVITAEVVNSDSNSCAVCKNEFEVDSSAKQMPCKHLYHSDCLIPWLQLHNSCPVCRYELPTDDPEYDNQRAGGGQGGNSEGSSESGSGSGGSQGEGRNSERRFRIALSWPFRMFGGSEGNNGGDNGGPGSGAQQGGSGGGGCDHGSEPRHESLD